MKSGAILRGGLLAGVAGTIVLASLGRGLRVAVWPWDWVSMSEGWFGFFIAWARTALFLLPIAVLLGVAIALVAAGVFEFITQRAGWLAGAAIGFALGMTGTATVALLPWSAFWLSYAFMPVMPPLGPYDPSWALLALVGTGIVMGAIAGACYGAPRHRPHDVPAFRWTHVRHGLSDETRQIASRL